ncbi:TraB/GumN family protein [Qipengyuania sp. RANM35]|uniref:TraB/GumN family protein n=1 Tax=Qipengyuania sp. RANM35 TaxID=3068635 RepID=UPI0034DB39C4
MNPLAKAIFGVLFGTLLLAGCGKKDKEFAEAGSQPALWEIRDGSGKVEGWLFGTIHALPEGTRWRTARLQSAIDEADLLVVEVGNLADGAAMAAQFRRLAFDGPQGKIRSRVTPAYREKLDAVLDKASIAESDLDTMETWAAALALAQAAQDGDGGNGADLALLADFRGRSVEELEGAQRQLSIFDTLPETEQRDLLQAVIDEIIGGTSEDDRLARDWLRGDVDALSRTADGGMLADPELREALLVRRNHDWAAKLATILARPEKPLVAVGAGHMGGPDGLAAMLEARGYSVARTQ